MVISGCTGNKRESSFIGFGKSNYRVKRPVVLPRGYWEGSLPSGSYMIQTPERITIMHEAVRHSQPDEDRLYLFTQQKQAIDDKGWGDLPYHYYIDSLGNIYRGRSPQHRAPEFEDGLDTGGQVFVTFLNDFDRLAPSTEEMASLIHLTAWLANEYDIPVSEVKSIEDRSSKKGAGKLLQAHFDQGLVEEKLQAILGELTPEPTPEPDSDKRLGSNSLPRLRGTTDLIPSDQQTGEDDDR